MAKKPSLSTKTGWQPSLRWLRSVWVFPAILATALLTLTALQISGSSVGVYSQIHGYVDDDALANDPRGVRSDEWLVTTQMTVAQDANGYDKTNENIAEGQNMSLLDVPYVDWSTFFKPQNLVFFVLPLEFAFAFKWWLLLVALILACYFFVLELFPKHVLRAALLALFVGLSPMVFWWWASGMLLTLAYSFLIALFTLRLIRATSRSKRILYTGLLAYTLACFGLLLYPPYQIPCLIVIATFLIGWITANYGGKEKLKTLLPLWPYALFAVLAPLLVGLAFYLTNKDIITDTTHTVYPGTRIVESGGTEPLLTFSNFLSPNLAYDEKAAEGYIANQSEASMFIFIAPYLFLPSLYLIIREKRKNGRILWGLLLINILLAVFFARMYVSTPWLEPFYRLLLLDKVPNVRLLIGLGLAGVLQLILLVKALDKATLQKSERWLMALGGAISALAVMLPIGAYTVDHYPVFIASFAKVLVFSLWIAAALFLLLYKRYIAGLILLILFSLLSVYRIHPLYRGLDPITDSTLVNTIKAFPDKGSWVVLDDRLLINFPLMAGKDSLSGVQFAPQMDLWKELDPDRRYEDVYNRYAHVLFASDESLAEPLVLKHTDMFLVKFEPCGKFLQDNAKYVLSPKKLDDPCVVQKKTIDTPARQLYIYEILPVAR